jgi:hypothetical protein
LLNVTTHSTRNLLNDVSFFSTIVDAAIALTRGERWSAAILLAAAALSRRVPGLGVVASVLARLARRR